MTYIAEPKLVNVTNWNRRLLKWTEEFFAFYWKSYLLKCLLDSWKAKIVVAAGISTLISLLECQDVLSSHLKYYQLSSEVQVKFLFWSGHFGPDMEKIKQLSECFKHRNTFGNIGNAVKVLVGTQSTRENLRPWTKARLTGDVFEVFGIIVVVGITRVKYFQFLEYKGYYLTKNWFVRASLGYLNE